MPSSVQNLRVKHPPLSLPLSFRIASFQLLLFPSGALTASCSPEALLYSPNLTKSLSASLALPLSTPIPVLLLIQSPRSCCIQRAVAWECIPCNYRPRGVKAQSRKIFPKVLDQAGCARLPLLLSCSSRSLDSGFRTVQYSVRNTGGGRAQVSCIFHQPMPVDSDEVWNMSKVDDP